MELKAHFLRVSDRPAHILRVSDRLAYFLRVSDRLAHFLRVSNRLAHFTLGVTVKVTGLLGATFVNLTFALRLSKTDPTTN